MHQACLAETHGSTLPLATLGSPETGPAHLQRAQFTYYSLHLSVCRLLGGRLGEQSQAQTSIAGGGDVFSPWVWRARYSPLVSAVHTPTDRRSGSR
ncbi:hypothetical protein [Streptomyces sp. CA-106131]